MYGIQTPVFDSNDYTNVVIHNKLTKNIAVTYGESLPAIPNLQLIYDTPKLVRRTSIAGSSQIIFRADRGNMNVLVASAIRSKAFINYVENLKKQGKYPRFLLDESFLLTDEKYGIEIRESDKVMFSTRFKNLKLIDMIPFPYDFLGLTSKYQQFKIIYKQKKKIAIALHLIDGREFDDSSSSRGDNFYTFTVEGNTIYSEIKGNQGGDIYEINRDFEMRDKFVYQKDNELSTYMLVFDVSNVGL